ncbi:release factor glutamine methyltransferase [Tepiditoga spiralis]|uniref:peptide chain release factor N(5)-glutamine methyltransferase n=1 Tax=Tepiditoga spiralis TaxID=2108365 RepID=A0A7G1G3K0_9BACT|nr:HemK/PrmC family methyltransferase [Tepiditoga spiralis]BBE31008.1 release factor glutamine methyltransferase [Tepiditoga spiralis]
MKLKDLINKTGDYDVSRFQLLKIISKIENKDMSYYLLNDDIKEGTIKKLLRVLNGYPLEYLINEVKFLNNKFYVDERVLIPRIETEDLVLYAKKTIEEENIKSIVDIGTGSGVIAISLKKYFPNMNVYAIDISEKALDVAKLNAKKLNVDINFYCGEYIEPIKDKISEIEMIVSNPPYVEESFKNNRLKYEPSIALYAGIDGQNFFKNLLKYEQLKGKIMLFETTEFNYKKTEEILKFFGNTKILKDSFDKKRFIEINNNNFI